MQVSNSYEIPVECLDFPEIENCNRFIAVKFSENHFKRQGLNVLPANDFEEDVLRALYHGSFDNYIRVKIGKSGLKSRKYSEWIDKIKSMPEMRKLLYLCRFCSYASGPGFPDIVLLDSSSQIKFRYVMFDGLDISQQLFLMLGIVMGMDFGVIGLACLKPKCFEVFPKDIINAVFNDSRTKRIMNGIQENISCSEGDELDYFLKEQERLPFKMMQKWLAEDVIRNEDLEVHMSFIEQQIELEQKKFTAFIAEISSDTAFNQITGKDEKSMKMRFDYIKNKFGLGDSRAKILLSLIV